MRAFFVAQGARAAGAVGRSKSLREPRPFHCWYLCGTPHALYMPFTYPRTIAGCVRAYERHDDTQSARETLTPRELGALRTRATQNAGRNT
jgi:hypothetical protein